jgi:hypothetical protein
VLVKNLGSFPNVQQARNTRTFTCAFTQVVSRLKQQKLAALERAKAKANRFASTNLITKCTNKKFRDVTFVLIILKY